MKKVYKYGTGDEIPKGAVYLTTQVEDVPQLDKKKGDDNFYKIVRLVWHYFLVDVK